MLKSFLSIFAIVGLALLLGGDDASPDAEPAVQAIKLHQLESTYEFVDWSNLDFLYVACYIPREGVYVQKHTRPRGVRSSHGLPIESRYWLPYEDLLNRGIDIRPLFANEVFPPFEPGGLHYVYRDLESDHVHYAEFGHLNTSFYYFFKEVIGRATPVDSIPDEVIQNRFATGSFYFADED